MGLWNDTVEDLLMFYAHFLRKLAAIKLNSYSGGVLKEGKALCFNSVPHCAL